MGDAHWVSFDKLNLMEAFQRQVRRQFRGCVALAPSCVRAHHWFVVHSWRALKWSGVTT
jgi:hypothetical protein